MILALVALGLLRDSIIPAPQYRGIDGRIRVEIPRVEAEVAVDGSLDEPAWAVAARLTGFSEYAPADGRPAEQETEILVWYSSSAIHFGVRAHAAPGTTRATLADRDRLTNEDLVEFILGTYNDGRQAMVFAVNPFGVQQDGIPPLREPEMLAARDARYLAEADVVFGIEINGDARAYPKRILAWHEMFVDRVGGIAVAGVYCTLCGAVIVYETVVDGRAHRLGTSGYLYCWFECLGSRLLGGYIARFGSGSGFGYTQSTRHSRSCHQPTRWYG